jgi:deoxycytidylate deaminase
MTPPVNVVREAIRVARLSPCAKSKRGVVTFDDKGIRASASNGPPPGFRCDGSDACRAACPKVAVHAEQRALFLEERVYGEEMLHVKVFGGELVPGGGPSCPDCSKLILEAGIVAMWLYEHRGNEAVWVRYTAEDFHRRTLLECGLPVLTAENLTSVPT